MGILSPNYYSTITRTVFVVGGKLVTNPEFQICVIPMGAVRQVLCKSVSRSNADITVKRGVDGVPDALTGKEDGVGSSAVERDQVSVATISIIPP